MVSVVIPAYNASNTIERALSSVVENRHLVTQVIVVDNNCIDDTIIKAKNFESRLPLTIIQESRPGASIARNSGLRLATSEFIQFLDADDELLPDKLEKQCELFNKKEIGFVAGSYLIRNHQYDTTINLNTEGSTNLLLFQGHLGITSSNLWRKQALDQVQGWNESLKSSQEADLMFRILKAGFIPALSNDLLTVIHHDALQRISTSNELENAIRFVELRKQMLSWMESEHSKDFEHNKRNYYDSYFKSICAIYNQDAKVAQTYLKAEFLTLFRLLSFKNRLRLIIKLLF